MVATHSGKSENSGNFQIIKNIRETLGDSGKFEDLKISEIFFLYLG